MHLKLASLVGKKAIALLRDPQGSTESVKKFLKIGIGIVLFIFLVPVMAVSLPGIFGKDIEDADFKDFDLANSKLYQKVCSVYETYQSDLNKEIQNKISAMKEQNEQKYAPSTEVTPQSFIGSNRKINSLLFLETNTPITILSSNKKTGWKEGDLLGTFSITGYCKCYECSEGYGGNTSTGAPAKANHTIAVDPDVIPYGTHVKIEGIPNTVFKAEDCGGGINQKDIDIYFDTHQETINWGRQNRKVYFVEGSDSDLEVGGDPDGGYSYVSANKTIVCILSYLLTKHTDIQSKADNFSVSRKEIRNFLDDITSVTISQSGTYPDIIYSSSVHVLDENQIAEKFFKEEEKQGQFLTSFESLQDTISDTVLPGGSTDLGDLVYPEKGMKIPLFLQHDKRWGNYPYGNGTLATSACGPTCMAMIISYLTEQTVSPLTVANWSMANGHYVPGVGSDWDLYPASAKNWNLKGYTIPVNAKSIMDELSKGHPVVTSMEPGTFTKEGHFIVLRGISKNNKILVNDPNDRMGDKDFYKKEFDISLIINECKGAWAFSK